MSGPVLVPILGDQLTRNLASLRGRAKDDTVILMMEVWDEATYVRHHKQKIALIFSAMRHFAKELEQAGWSVDYVKLDNADNAGSFSAMVLFADGGKLSSKPYAASGNYINKMSDYCRDCTYSVTKKTGEGACPFNALYWNFMHRHRDRLESNHRIGRIYSTWDRMSGEKRAAYLESAKAFLDTLQPADKAWSRGR